MRIFISGPVFGFPLSRPQINLWRASNGRQATRSHGGGRKRRPIDAERQSGKGYVPCII